MYATDGQTDGQKQRLLPPSLRSVGGITSLELRLNLVSDGLSVLLEDHDGVRDFDVDWNDDVFDVERSFESCCQSQQLVCRHIHTPVQLVKQLQRASRADGRHE